MDTKKILFSTISLLPLCCVAQDRPNIIIIFSDDQGYQDLGCYGSPDINTPNIDRIAKEGLKLTSFYVSASVSSASRAGLMTGRLNTHNGVTGVLWPDSKGLPLSETTIAEALKDKGYATACFGKWHLGDLEGYLPTDRGFDEYFGIPYSNDMFLGSTHEFSDTVKWNDGYTLEKALEDQNLVRNSKKRGEIRKVLGSRSPLFDGKNVVEYPCDQSTTTRRYFDRAIDFISNTDSPFFLYITPSMPHVPLYASEQFKGKSRRGLYGDVIEEIDWNVGRLLDYLDENGLSNNTLIIYSSDNGPWLEKKQDGGCVSPLRGGKFTLYEGGVRTPCVMCWKGKIPANKVSDEIVASIDLFPTIMHYVGGDISGLSIDGIDVSDFIENPDKKSQRDEYLYVFNGKIEGLRKNDWVYLPNTGKHKKSANAQELFNIKHDVSESNNVFKVNGKVVIKMKSLLDKICKE